MTRDSIGSISVNNFSSVSVNTLIRKSYIKRYINTVIFLLTVGSIVINIRIDTGTDPAIRLIFGGGSCYHFDLY